MFEKLLKTGTVGANWTGCGGVCRVPELLYGFMLHKEKKALCGEGLRGWRCLTVHVPCTPPHIKMHFPLKWYTFKQTDKHINYHYDGRTAAK